MSLKIPVDASLQKLVNKFGIEEGLIAVYNNLLHCLDNLQCDLNNTSKDDEEYQYLVEMFITTKEQIRMLKSIISFYDPSVFSCAENKAIENCMHL